MISSIEFIEYLKSLGVDTAIGVPDSTFKGLISCFESSGKIGHITACNECEAAAISAGYYLANKKPAITYMQNSGFGKIVNPYTSLYSPEIYGISGLFLVGWRGKPGEKDEPQHKTIGRVMIALIQTLEIPYTILNESKWKNQLSGAYRYSLSNEIPYILIISKGLFDSFSSVNTEPEISTLLLRENVLELINDKFAPNTFFVSTTGKTSRELFEIRERRNQKHCNDFLTVGSMGCASTIAFGIALKKPDKKICVIDGDGAALMQLGSMATIGHYQLKNLVHIIIDNNSHESTGGQSTVSNSVDFGVIGKACGYPNIYYAQGEEDICNAIKQINSLDSLSLLIIKCRKGCRDSLGRPTTSPLENKYSFMKNLGAQ